VFSLVLLEECARMLVFYDPSLSGHGARIWGEHGQSALKRTHICVLNCGPTRSESLKNLVLGGISSFTVVDASKVCASDLGNNYFVDWDSLGQSKAKTVSALLHELNDAVDAKFMEEMPEALLESNPAFFSRFTLVIATQVKLQMSVVLRVLSFCI
jgi:amyloid beta precursor protein binding protein 1